MKKAAQKVALNRPVFTQHTFDSSKLTVLTTLLHRFPEAGDYELFLRRRERIVHRARVHVTAEDAPYQIDVDLAMLGRPGMPSQHAAPTGYTVAVNGVMAFYVSQGTEQYSVTIKQLDRKEKRTLLESRRAVPETDLFAVTLTLPGVYTASSSIGRGQGEIPVALPKDKGYRPDQATLIEVNRRGTFNPRRVQIFAGQTVVLRGAVPARFRIELVKPGEPDRRPIERPPHTLRKPRARREDG